MDSSLPILSFAGAAVMATAAAYPKLRARLALSRAKHGSLTGHSKMSPRVARLIPFYEFDLDHFLPSVRALAEVATLPQHGVFRRGRLVGLGLGLFTLARHASGGAGGRAHPGPTPPFAFGEFCRGLSWLVGRCAARRGQPDFAARNLSPGRYVGADAPGPENAAR